MNKFKEINHCRVEKIVASFVGKESLNDRSKQVDSDDVPVVELVLQSD